MTIMCTKDLWRRLGGRGDLSDRPPPDAEPTRLGAWAAKAVPLSEGVCCVALNETTYLTLAFPLLPVPAFEGVFAAALRLELEHMGVSAGVIGAELAPFFGEVTFARNTNRSLLGSLNDVCFHFAHRIRHMGSIDPSTLIAVQHSLNRMPHTRRDIPFPDQAALLLLSAEGHHEVCGQPNIL